MTLKIILVVAAAGACISYLYRPFMTTMQGIVTVTLTHCAMMLLTYWIILQILIGG